MKTMESSIEVYVGNYYVMQPCSEDGSENYDDATLHPFDIFSNEDSVAVYPRSLRV